MTHTFPFLFSSSAGGASQKAADAASITTAVLLDELRATSLGNDSAGPTVVVEFLHDVTKRVLEGLDLLSSMPATSAFHSNELETGLIAITSLQPRVEAIIENLLRVRRKRNEALKNVKVALPLSFYLCSKCFNVNITKRRQNLTRNNHHHNPLQMKYMN